MARVLLKGLSKTYLGTKKPAVQDLNLEVSDREFVALLGDPGAGKTTTLRLVAGLEKPSAGEIYLDDALVNDLTPQERDVAMVFQSFALYPHRTVHDNIAFPLRKKHIPKEEIDRLVKNAAGILGIEHVLDKKPATLSGGEKQRVAVARAVVRKPKVYLFDEPLSNLDAKLRIQMRVELRKLQREFGQTILYATADESEAMVMADKIAVMHEGRIVQYDTKRVIYDSPKDVRVASMVGTPPMNLLDCSLVEKSGKTLLDFGEFTLDIAGLAQSQLARNAQNVYAGIRASDIVVSPKANGESVRADVEAVEVVGDSYVLDLKIGGTTLQALFAGEYGAAQWTEVWLSFRKEKIHLFDKQTGAAIA